MSTFTDLLPLLIHSALVFLFVLPFSTLTGISFIQNRRTKAYGRSCAKSVVTGFYPWAVFAMIIPITLYQVQGFESDILDQNLLIHINTGMLMLSFYPLETRGIDHLARRRPQNAKSLTQNDTKGRTIATRMRTQMTPKVVNFESDSDAYEFDELPRNSETENEEEEENEAKLEPHKERKSKMREMRVEKRKKSNRFWRNLANLLKSLILSIKSLLLLMMVISRESKATRDMVGVVSDAFLLGLALTTQISILILLIISYWFIEDRSGTLQEVGKVHVMEIVILTVGVLILIGLISSGYDGLTEVCIFLGILYTILIISEAIFVQTAMFGIKEGLMKWVPSCCIKEPDHRGDIIKEAAAIGARLQDTEKGLGSFEGFGSSGEDNDDWHKNTVVSMADMLSDRNLCAGFIWHLQSTWTSEQLLYLVEYEKFLKMQYPGKINEILKGPSFDWIDDNPWLDVDSPKGHAVYLFEKFVHLDAPFALNLSTIIRREIGEALSNVTVDIGESDDEKKEDGDMQEKHDWAVLFGKARSDILVNLEESYQRYIEEFSEKARQYTSAELRAVTLKFLQGFYRDVRKEKRKSYKQDLWDASQRRAIQRVRSLPQRPSVNLPQRPRRYSVNLAQRPSMNRPQRHWVNLPQRPSMNRPQRASINIPPPPSISRPQRPSMINKQISSLLPPPPPAPPPPKSHASDQNNPMDAKEGGQQN